MDNSFEQLDPETFQELCQALLVREYPRVQCFPVGQPDGGRDAIVFLASNAGRRISREFMVFQVKFVRKPESLTEPHKWLTDTLYGEREKIANLVPKGASEYILITNVRGTAHPNVGSIDRAQATLDAGLGIPAQVWWREDLNRRLEGTPELKWAYPQLLGGMDVLQALVGSGLTEERERRAACVRAFLADQFEADRDLKFKQVELQDALMTLFVDVPLSEEPLRHRNHKSRDFQEILFRLRRSRQELTAGAVRMPDREVGTAQFLLDGDAQTIAPHIVLEGAPGQGKSTVVQYVAQVHRARLLGHQSMLKDAQQGDLRGPLRLPIKVDLRDLATWIAGKNPFVTDSSEPPPGWKASLEAFLAALITHQSGGSEFTVPDLHSVTRASSVLLLLDGLDEVADVAHRNRVVEEVSKSVRRLREISLNLQVVVTSRPTAFTGPLTFPEQLFDYVHLGDLSRQTIDVYADKWLSARRLPDREAAGVKRILRDKLGQPHLRELARNAMQLTILLSLMHTRGASLPDKRTALYDSYVDTFFNRESEKSVLVRENRDLLIEIHRFLAWKLHAAAEVDGTNGRVSTEELKRLVHDFLVAEDRDASFAEELFAGMIERVVAIVSRVEGLYEFEVQPLREYFAARYLSETAPYSPPGAECHGTKPDRFDALLRNFYWFNVTRFFAGCFSKGELPSAVDRLQELVRAPGYAELAYPRVVAATLLSDWVFAQHRKSLKDIVALVLDGIGLRYVLTTRRGALRDGAPLVLPEGNGREELAARCWAILDDNPPLDYARDVLEVLRPNISRPLLESEWMLRVKSASRGARVTWLKFGTLLGVLPQVGPDALEEILGADELTFEEASVLIVARQDRFLARDGRNYQKAIDAVLEGYVSNGTPGRGKSNTLARFSSILAPALYERAFDFPDPRPLSEIWRRFASVAAAEHSGDEESESLWTSLFEPCAETIEIARGVATRDARVWATDLAPWEELVDAVTARWGERWIARQLAASSAGIRSKETCKGNEDLFDASKPLCRRARYARLRAGQPSWWINQLKEVTNGADATFGILILFRWGSPATLSKLLGSIDEMLAELASEDWRRLFEALARGRHGQSRSLEIEVGALQRLSPRAAVALGLQMPGVASEQVYERFMKRYSGSDSGVLEFCLNLGLERLARGAPGSGAALEVVQRTYAAGVRHSRVALERGFAHGRNEVTLEVAKAVMKTPEQFPGELVAAAERRCSRQVASDVEPLAAVAKRESWTFR